MAHKIKLLYSLRQSLFSATSTSVTRQLIHGKFDPVKRWVKEFESSIHKGSPNFACKLNIINQCTRTAHLSGSKLGLGCWLGVSFVSGCTSISSPVAHSMDGYDVLVDDRDYSDGEDNSHTLRLFIRKFWLPFFFIVTTFSQLWHPSLLITNAVFILLSTKPNPLSVFAFVEKLCKRLMRREPHLYLFKSLYANRVNVRDYKLLCLATVEIRDQKFTLVGILVGAILLLIFWFPEPSRRHLSSVHRTFHHYLGLTRRNPVYVYLTGYDDRRPLYFRNL